MNSSIIKLYVPYPTTLSPNETRPSVYALNGVGSYWLDGANRDSPQNSIETHNVPVFHEGRWRFKITLMMSRRNAQNLGLNATFREISTEFCINTIPG